MYDKLIIIIILLQMGSHNSTIKGKIGTGAKTRTIKADDVANNSDFEFNKSINPHGSPDASMVVSKTRKGHARVELYQDLNNDGIIKGNERIYKGKCLDRQSGDKLLNFYGDIKLSKTMHQCDWLAQKNPDKLAGCTMELIPTSFTLTLTDESGDVFDFQALGPYKTDGIVVIEKLNTPV